MSLSSAFPRAKSCFRTVRTGGVGGDWRCEYGRGEVYDLAGRIVGSKGETIFGRVDSVWPKDSVDFSVIIAELSPSCLLFPVKNSLERFNLSLMFMDTDRAELGREDGRDGIGEGKAEMLAEVDMKLSVLSICMARRGSNRC